MTDPTDQGGRDGILCEFFKDSIGRVAPILCGNFYAVSRAAAIGIGKMIQEITLNSVIIIDNVITNRNLPRCYRHVFNIKILIVVYCKRLGGGVVYLPPGAVKKLNIPDLVDFIYIYCYVNSRRALVVPRSGRGRGYGVCLGQDIIRGFQGDLIALSPNRRGSLLGAEAQAPVRGIQFQPGGEGGSDGKADRRTLGLQCRRWKLVAVVKGHRPLTVDGRGIIGEAYRFFMDGYVDGYVFCCR